MFPHSPLLLQRPPPTHTKAPHGLSIQLYDVKLIHPILEPLPTLGYFHSPDPGERNVCVSPLLCNHSCTVCTKGQDAEDRGGAGIQWEGVQMLGAHAREAHPMRDRACR